MQFDPSRRFLNFPAWAWLLPAFFLGITVAALGVPAKLPEPSNAAALFHEPILVTKIKNELTFVTPETRMLGPKVWNVVLIADEESNVKWQFGKHGTQFVLGLYRQQSRWKYRLSAILLDGSDPKSTGDESMNALDRAKLRPMLIEGLNRRYPEEQAGAKLEELLDDGLEQVSYMCIQNYVMVLFGLSLVLALIATVVMIHPIIPARPPPSPTPAQEPALAEPAQNPSPPAL